MKANLQQIIGSREESKPLSSLPKVVSAQDRSISGWYRLTSLPAFSRNVEQLDPHSARRIIRAVRIGGTSMPHPCPLSEGAELYLVGIEQELTRLAHLLELKIISHGCELPDEV